MQTTDTMTTTRVPLLECEPWCEAGDGHPAEHPEDRRCFTSGGSVPMTLPEPYQELDDIWVLASTNVHLRRDRGEDFTRVLLNHMAGGRPEVDVWLEYTVDEAEGLTNALGSAVRVARTGTLTTGEAYAAALLEALARHLEKPVSMPDLEALCAVLGVRASEIAARAEEIQRGA